MVHDLTLREILVARRSLQEVARRERKPLKAIMDEINEAIAEMRANTDPSVMAQWAQSPFADRAPSPEEFVAWCTRLVREKEQADESDS